MEKQTLIFLTPAAIARAGRPPGDEIGFPVHAKACVERQCGSTGMAFQTTVPGKFNRRGATPEDAVTDFSDYIALQRVRLRPVRLAGLPFWAPERPYI